MMTKFSELTEFVAIPRVASLELAPDGSWLAATVSMLSPDKKKYVSSIWRIDTSGGAPERLTRSAEGERAAAFLPDGSLLFVSSRKDPSAKADDSQAAKPALWALPAGRGEALRVAAPPGGVAGVAAARQAQAYLITAPVFDGTKDAAEDAARRKARADADVNAILHTSAYRVRYWDSDLGPDNLRLMAGNTTAGGQPADDAGPRDLTPDPGWALHQRDFCLSPDGSVAVTSWQVPAGVGGSRVELATIDVATGERRTLLSDENCDFEHAVISPDGKLVMVSRFEHDSYERPGDSTLIVASFADDGEPRDLLAGFDRYPAGAIWSPDSATVYFTADDNGRRPIFAVDVAGGEVRRLTTDDAAYDSLCVTPDGQVLYALRNAIAEPATPVRIELAGGDLVRLQSPAGSLEVPGQVREISTTVADGSTVRAWLVLPDGASAQAKVPMLLWVHGGPVSSWSQWSWRWNPWLPAARGYAVLLPDPALSTGYGLDFIARGHGTWGDTPFTDVMSITDAAIAEPEIDGDRTAMMGGSFGGYMANWIAGHTDRFAGIVSHAGLWALDQVFGTTDGPYYWRREWGYPDSQPERYAANSPHLHVDAITTPMLVIHGDKDYRVPVGEALRLWADLISRGKDVKFLYFPDENHWILKPGDAVVWYETVFAFLAERVLGEEWRRPELL
ncbi:MAG TPA: S9 family peptidase [Streptosporangiaceae bacterium]|nr:S9 family peptidase [Streptosporangiaceae bacterium]